MPSSIALVLFIGFQRMLSCCYVGLFGVFFWSSALLRFCWFVCIRASCEYCKPSPFLISLNLVSSALAMFVLQSTSWLFWSRCRDPSSGEHQIKLIPYQTASFHPTAHQSRLSLLRLFLHVELRQDVRGEVAVDLRRSAWLEWTIRRPTSTESGR